MPHIGSDMYLTEGNLRNASGVILGIKGTVSSGGGGISAEATLFSMRIPPFNGVNGLVNRPFAISQIRVKLVTTTAFTGQAGTALELHKTTTTANHNTGGTQILAQAKKTSGYEPIPASELDAYITAGSPISGGSHVIQGSEAGPFEFAVGAGSTPVIDAIWWPEDGKPLVLEQNEGIILQNGNALGANGVALLFVGMDLVRF